MQKYVNVIRYFPLQNMQELLYIGLLSSNTIFKKRFGFKYVTWDKETLCLPRYSGIFVGSFKQKIMENITGNFTNDLLSCVNFFYVFCTNVTQYFEKLFRMNKRTLTSIVRIALFTLVTLRKKIKLLGSPFEFVCRNIKSCIFL